jgi:hypothetical protein
VLARVHQYLPVLFSQFAAYRRSFDELRTGTNNSDYLHI